MARDLSRSGLAVLLGLMIIVPLLNYYRVSPSPTLYSEAAAGVFFLLAAAISGPLLPASQRVHASLIAFATGMLGVLAYQVFSEKYYQFALSWVPWGGYLILFLIAAAMGQLASAAPDLRTLVVDRLTHALALTALLNAVAQTAQATGWALQIQPFVFVPKPEVFASYVCSPAGNVAQVNHTNTLAWLGIASLIYLIATRRSRTSIGAIGVSTLLLSSAFTSSRMAWLMVMAVAYLLVIAGNGLGWSRRRCTLTGAMLILALLLATTIKGLILMPGCVTSLDRVLGSGGNFDYWVRIDLMRQALMVWWSQPILGVGVGKFMASTFALEPRRDFFQPLDYFPHNALLEILASFGIVGMGLLVCCGLVWVKRAWSNRTSSPQHWPMLTGVVLLSIHAMLEMPLWYLYFLIPFGIMLGIVIGPVRIGERAVAVRWDWLFAAVALIGIGGFLYGIRDHARAERIIWLGDLAREQPLLASDAIAAIVDDVRGLRIFAIAGQRELLRFADINRANAPALSIANRRLLENIPDPQSIASQVMLEAIGGQLNEARDLFRRLMMFYPRHYEALAAEIRKRAEARPDETAGLVEMIDAEMARPPRPRR